MKTGDRVRMTELGERMLLPGFTKKVTTGVVEAIVTESGDIIRVQRDGLRKTDSTFADYWEVTR